LAVLQQEHVKQHDEAVQKALSEYHTLLGTTRSPAERAAVVMKLGEGERDPRIVAELSSRLSDAEAVRAEAITALGKYRREERAAQALARVLPAAAKAPATLAKVLDALAAVGHPAAVTAVSRLARHPDATVAAAAARALGEMHAVAAIEPLLTAWEAIDQEKKKGGDAQRVAEERWQRVGEPLRGALAKLIGQNLGSSTEMRSWWIKNRSTHRLKDPLPPALCP
jgi:HEAT repeat protein